ncbi:hypothetical protein [Desulfuromonas sp. DDH964]
MDIVSASGPLGLASGLAGLLIFLLLALLSLLVPVFVWRIWVWTARSNRELQQLNVALEQILARLETGAAVPGPVAEQHPAAATSPAAEPTGAAPIDEELFPPAEPYESDDEILEGEPLEDDFGAAFSDNAAAAPSWQEENRAAAEFAAEESAAASEAEEEPSFAGFDAEPMRDTDQDDFPDIDFEADIAQGQPAASTHQEETFAAEDPFAAGTDAEEEWPPPAEAEPPTPSADFAPPAPEEPPAPAAAFEASVPDEAAADTFATPPFPAAATPEPLPEVPAPPAPEPPAPAPPDVISLPQDPQRPATNLARCGGCGHKLAYKESLAGKRVKCPSCQKPLVLP